MKRTLLITWPGGGNQTPAIALAQRLIGRGDQVTIAGYPTQRDRFAGLDAEFAVLPRAAELFTPAGPDEVMAMITRSVWACPEHLADVPDLIAAYDPDVVVVDCLMLAAITALVGTDLPIAVLVHSAPGAIAPPGGSFDSALIGLANRVRALRSLPEAASVWDLWAPHTVLAASIPELDPLAVHVPASFHWCGPLLEEGGTSPWRSPWPDDDPRPLVLVSFSTGRAWDQTTRIQRTLDGLADAPVRLLVTSGAVDPSSLTVRGNAVVVDRLPHRDVIPKASVAVTHAGHGTLACALANAVPVVALPNLAADQPALAARASHLGAGISLDGDGARPAEIAAAVRRVLEDGRYRQAAAALADVISTTSKARRALDLV